MRCRRGVGAIISCLWVSKGDLEGYVRKPDNTCSMGLYFRASRWGVSGLAVCGEVVLDDPGRYGLKPEGILTRAGDLRGPPCGSADSSSIAASGCLKQVCSK
jgi:hypothetical protein